MTEGIPDPKPLVYDEDATMDRERAARSPAYPSNYPSYAQRGMTQRQWYVGQALGGVHITVTAGDSVDAIKDIARTIALVAGAIADACIAEDAKQ